MTDFAEVMKTERHRLNAEKQDISKQIDTLKGKLAGLDKELKAIEAYERAKTGAVTGAGTRRKGVRQEVLATVKAHPEGIARGALIEKMGATSDKAQTQSISNALQALKKSGEAVADGGVYKAL